MTTLHADPLTLELRTSGSDRGPAVRPADLWHALTTLFVPGSAGDDVVPAVHAADAQALLVTVGVLAPGEVSDRWDAPTVDAVRAFQRARGLPETGVADHRTADALLVAADRHTAALAG